MLIRDIVALGIQNRSRRLSVSFCCGELIASDQSAALVLRSLLTLNNIRRVKLPVLTQQRNAPHDAFAEYTQHRFGFPDLSSELQHNRF